MLIAAANRATITEGERDMGGEHHVDDSNCGCMQCQADDEAYDDETSDCDCWEYEHIDPLTGCATCGRCGARRYLSSEQMAELSRLQAEYGEAIGECTER